MTNTTIIKDRINQPAFYHREYENDVKGIKPKGSILENTQRLALIALPFISLYKPFGSAISMGMNTVRSFSCVAQTKEAATKGQNKEIAFAVLQSCVAVAAVAGTIFGSFYGMMITTGHDVLINIHEIFQRLNCGENEQALESFLHLVGNSLYLTMLLHGSLEIVVLSLAAQVLIELYKSQAAFKKFKNGNALDILEGVAGLAMAGIRGYQMQPQLKMLQHKLELQKVIKQQTNKHDQMVDLTKNNSGSASNKPNLKISNNEQISQKNCTGVSNVKNSVNSSVFYAYKVEFVNYQGVYSQIAYYSDATTVITNYSGQYVFTGSGVQRSYSSTHYNEWLNGISYLVFVHNGGKVYSAEFSQFIVIY